jgi:hypothetical protein
MADPCDLGLGPPLTEDGLGALDHRIRNRVGRPGRAPQSFDQLVV